MSGCAQEAPISLKARADRLLTSLYHLNAAMRAVDEAVESGASMEQHLPTCQGGLAQVLLGCESLVRVLEDRVRRISDRLGIDMPAEKKDDDQKSPSFYIVTPDPDQDRVTENFVKKFKDSSHLGPR